MRETKKERFVRIAEARTNKIINMIRLLSNCSNEANYDYSDEEVKRIFTAIESEVKIAKAKFLEAEITDKAFKLY